MKFIHIFLFILALAPQLALAINDTRQMENVSWDEKLGSIIDLNSKIISTDGSNMSLDQILDQDKPTVFVLAYYSCPRMCTFLLDGTFDAVSSNTEARPGIDYNLVTLSFDSSDSPEFARSKEEKYEKKLNQGESWNFFVAEDISIKSISDSVGFKFVKDGNDFAHPAGIIFLTKERKISRYLTGVIFDPKDFKLALLEASGGVIGESTITDKVLLYCYDFDPVGKKYALEALNVIKLGGAVTLIALSVFLGFMWLRKEMK